ncbi:MAG: sigma-54-dependent Fis family transcriptional regulator, partial [Aquabacterium sp.]|uniref:sigma 54-interacting transcriptional regulator n=1 Tax=Aquabacterium sp. TaxID=1872578 RepID=UPI00121C3A0A
LQERQVVRLGSRKAIALDVRLVAATNIDLGRAVEAQHFRADLYYRLSVASVRLPPLRERPADIVPLARHFISVYRSRLHLEEVMLTEDAQRALLNYSWPGNIRELENVIHFALIVCKDAVITAQDIKLVPLSGAAPAVQAGLIPGGLGVNAEASGASLEPQRQTDYSAHVPANESFAPAGSSLPQFEQQGEDGLVLLNKALSTLLSEDREALFDVVESAVVHAAFAHATQNQVKAAKVLGITRNMLRTQLQRHGLLVRKEERLELSSSVDADDALHRSAA